MYSNRSNKSKKAQTRRMRTYTSVVRCTFWEGGGWLSNEPIFKKNITEMRDHKLSVGY